MREDWIETTLENICEKAEKVKRKEKSLNEALIYLDIGGINNQTNQIVSHKEYTWLDAPSRAQQVVKNGDVLFSTVRTYLKNIAPVNNPQFHNQICSSGFTVIRGISGVVEKKLLLFLSLYNGFLNSLSKLQTGTSYPAVRDKDVFAQKLNLPPLPEQRAIVAKIEQLFNELDNGIANLMTAQEQLKIYRQAVLKKAFAGEWKKAFVGDLFDFMGGGTPSKQEPLYWNGDIPWASVKDIKGDYLKKTQDYITETGVNNSSTNIAKKDEVILITRISPGKTVITLFDVSVNQDLKIIKPKFKTYNVFIHYLFKSIEWDIVKLSSGTTVLGINLTNLKSIEIPKIELEEQHQIVQQIESRLSVCDKVEETITVNLQKAEALRQSILKKAFAGELLTEAEIAACKKEKDWEPAGELLKRIKKEKTKT